MEVIVFSSPGCKLTQNNEPILRDQNVNPDLWDVTYKFVIDNNSEFEIRETLNSFFARLIFNILNIIGGYQSSAFRDMHHKAREKNKKIANFFLMPLIRKKGKLIIKPINCNDDTLICVYLLKTKTPFMVDVFDGEVEIVENKRGFK